jgi:hypothetical protein
MQLRPTIWRAVGAAMSLAALAGCQAIHLYDGPERPRAALAEVYVVTPYATTYQLNGKPFDPMYKHRAYLQPGQCDVALKTGQYLKAGDDKNRYDATYKLSFAVQSGKTYSFNTPDAQVYSYNLNNKKLELCVFEEEQDSPSGDTDFFNEYRSAGASAKRLACAPGEIRATPKP